MKHLLIGVAMAAALAMTATVANATTVLAFGLSSGTISGTQNDPVTGQTTITGSVPITIDEIAGTDPHMNPFLATFSINATSTDTAQLVGGDIIQHFSGSFSIIATAGSTNVLSGTFSDGVFGSGSGLVL